MPHLVLWCVLRIVMHHNQDMISARKWRCRAGGAVTLRNLYAETGLDLLPNLAALPGLKRPIKILRPPAHGPD